MVWDQNFSLHVMQWVSLPLLKLRLFLQIVRKDLTARNALSDSGILPIPVASNPLRLFDS